MVQACVSRLRCAVVLALLAGPAAGAVAQEGAALSGQLPAAGLGSALPAVSHHVVVISIDGLRPDAIERFGATTLQRLMREGSYTLAASTIQPSRTIPSHTSMLTGEAPDAHGIVTTGHVDHDDVLVPTVFAHTTAAGLRSAAFFSKGKLQYLGAPGILSHLAAPSGRGRWSAGRTLLQVERHLATERPNLLFIHFREPDSAGHLFSWMSVFYAQAVRRADRAVARTLELATQAFGEGNFTVIVTADHGGHGWDHGSTDPRDVTIPWIAWGRGVEPGTLLGPGIRTMDTGATALWLLGVRETVSGEPVLAAFRETRPGSIAAEAAGAPAGVAPVH